VLPNYGFPRQRRTRSSAARKVCALFSKAARFAPARLVVQINRDGGEVREIEPITISTLATTAALVRLWRVFLRRVAD
jgi:hypothetical protein